MTRNISRFSTFVLSIAALSVGLLAVSATSSSQAKDDPPAKLTPKQQVADAKAKLDEMKGVITEGFEQLAAAKAADDLQRQQSINQALSAIKGLVRLAEQSFMSLQEQAAKGNAKKAEHEFVKISIAHTKVMELQGQLRAAVGGGIGGTVDGKPSIDKTKDPDIPGEQPAESPASGSEPFSSSGGTTADTSVTGGGDNSLDVDVNRPPDASAVFAN